MMVKPSVTELLKKASNRYELVIVTAKRARRIVERRLIEKKKAMANENFVAKTKEESPVTLAAEELAADKIEIIKGE